MIAFAHPKMGSRNSREAAEGGRPPGPARVSAETSGGDPPTSSAVISTDTEQLGDEIARLAAHIHAATYRLLTLIRAFDEREGWGGGFLSCAHWLSWRTGMAPGAAREKVRVARALGSLPLLSEAMARGELSYSKVRALTRVATPENEAELLEVGCQATAAHIEKLVRVWRSVDRQADAEEERERHRSRYLRLHPDDDGMWRLEGRLDPEVGALLEKALEWASEALYCQDRTSSSAAGRGATTADEGSLEEPVPLWPEPRISFAQRRADALGLLAEHWMSTGKGDDETPLASSDTSGRQAPLGRADRFQVVVHVEAEALTQGAGRSTSVDHGPAVLEEAGLGVSAETSRRLACDASVVEMSHDAKGGVLDVGRKRRTVPPAIRRALEHRDKGCRFPGCGLRHTDAHHIEHWADGGETKLDNLVLLCRRHHRLVHEEGFRVALGEVSAERRRVTEEEDGAQRPRGPRSLCGTDGAGLSGATPGPSLRFVRPDERVIPVVPEAPPAPAQPVPALEETHRVQGIEPDAWTATPRWNGEPFDLGLALDMLRVLDSVPEV